MKGNKGEIHIGLERELYKYISHHKSFPNCLKKNLNASRPSDDSHIQRIVLATVETTVTQQVSHRP